MRGILITVLIGSLAAAAFAQQNPPQQNPPPQKPASEAGNPPKAATAGAKSSTEQSAAPRRTRTAVRALSIRLPDIHFQDTPLEDVFVGLAKMCDVNIVVRWEELERLGIERDKPISLSVRNMRLSQVLWLIMNEAAGEDVKLAYRADEAFIVVTSMQDVEREMVVRVYDVNDLLASRLRRPFFGAVRQHTYVAGAEPAVAEGAVGTRPIIGNATSGVLIEGEDPMGEDEEDGRVSREAHMRQLIETIVTSVEPDSWAQNGGEGTITSYRGMLVVRNTPLVHQQIGGASGE